MLVLDGVEMLDVREAATLADRTPETVRRWIWVGRLSARRQGNKLWVARRDVEDLVLGDEPGTKLSLATWARLVDEQRRSGALGTPSKESSAAQLILEGRMDREAG